MDISVRVPETSIFEDTLPYIMAFTPLRVRRRVWARTDEEEEIIEVLINIEHLEIKAENLDYIEDIIDKIFMNDIQPSDGQKYHIYDINAFLRADLQRVFEYFLMPHDAYSILVDDRDLEAEMEEHDLEAADQIGEIDDGPDSLEHWRDVMDERRYQNKLNEPDLDDTEY